MGKHSFPTILPNKETQYILFQTPQISIESLQSLLFWKLKPGTPQDYPIFTLIDRNQNLLERPFSYFFAFCNTFFYTQLASFFHLLRDFYSVHDHFLAFCCFFISERFGYLSLDFLKIFSFFF